jgi:hypothetical protein
MISPAAGTRRGPTLKAAPLDPEINPDRSLCDLQVDAGITFSVAGIRGPPYFRLRHAGRASDAISSRTLTRIRTSE